MLLVACETCSLGQTGTVNLLPNFLGHMGYTRLMTRFMAVVKTQCLLAGRKAQLSALRNTSPPFYSI